VIGKLFLRWSMEGFGVLSLVYPFFIHAASETSVC